MLTAVDLFAGAGGFTTGARMTAPDLPAPLVPAEVDLRDFAFMPLRTL